MAETLLFKSFIYSPDLTGPNWSSYIKERETQKLEKLGLDNYYLSVIHRLSIHTDMTISHDWIEVPPKKHKM